MLYYYNAGDNESVLLLLLIPRLSYKTDLLQSQLRQKVMADLISLTTNVSDTQYLVKWAGCIASTYKSVGRIFIRGSFMNIIKIDALGRTTDIHPLPHKKILKSRGFKMLFPAFNKRYIFAFIFSAAF